ncbi:hypothetical protein BGM24_25300 [Bacillus sp. FJAT-26377]|nr:hypothetical protein [Bacillus sp. FJAT-26377]
MKSYTKGVRIAVVKATEKKWPENEGLGYSKGAAALIRLKLHERCTNCSCKSYRKEAHGE